MKSIVGKTDLEQLLLYLQYYYIFYQIYLTNVIFKSFLYSSSIVFLEKYHLIILLYDIKLYSLNQVSAIHHSREKLIGIQKIFVEIIIFIRKNDGRQIYGSFQGIIITDTLKQGGRSHIPEVRVNQVRHGRNWEIKNYSNLSKTHLEVLFIQPRLSSRKNKNPKKNWKTEEVYLLIYITDKYCFIHKSQLQNLTSYTWQQIAEMIPYRNGIECMFKMLSVRKCHLSQYPWCQQEDQLFKILIQQHKLKWDIISRNLFIKSPVRIFRNSKQCKQHYMCFFDPSIRKGSWSIEEDYALACLYLEMGRKWSKMAKVIQGRNQNAIKNRFYLLFQHIRNSKCRAQRDMRVNVLRFKKKCQNDVFFSKKNPKIEQSAQKHSTQDNASQICYDNRIQMNDPQDIVQSKFTLLNQYHQSFAQYLNL